MRAEYASLAGGKLSWALGCWAAMFGWRLRADAPYLAALTATVVVLYFSSFKAWLFEVTPRSVFGVLIQLDINTHLVLMLLAATALNAFEPRRPLLTALTLITMQNLHFV